VPYIHSQLLHYDILDENDLEGTFRDPIKYQGLEIGRITPMLFTYNRESQQQTPWTLSPDPEIRGDIQEDPTNIITGREIAVAPPILSHDDDSKMSKTSSATYSVSEECERSKDRLARLDIPPLPRGNKEAIGWGEMLPWLLSGQFWYHNGVHACNIPVTTDENRMLSQDLLTVIQRAATVHKSAATQRGVQSLLKEEISSVNGLALIKEGKGFELFQLRIRTGYSRGLGSETMSYLWDFMHAVQHSEETVDSFATRLELLYKQVMLAEGCEMGDLTKKSIFVFGLAKGAYSEVLSPFAKKIQLGQGKLKLKTATLRSIQSDATNLLVTSRYYKDNVSRPGRKPASARLADTVSPPPSTDTSSDPMVTKLFSHIRQKHNLPRDVTDWIRQTYDCVHCFSNGHDTSGCFSMRRKYNVKLKTGSEGSDKSKSTPNSTASGGVTGRQVVETKSDTPPEKASVATVGSTTGKRLPSTNPGKPPAEPTSTRDEVSVGSSSDSSEADESDDTFTIFNTFAETDTDMLDALNQMAARNVEDGRRTATLDSGLAPKPLSTKGKKTVARVTTSDSQWFHKPETMCESWEGWNSTGTDGVVVNEIANLSTSYSEPATRVLCPDSGATNVMGPHLDMFIDYSDIRNDNRYVRLGDESRWILIHGIGTLCMEVDGLRVAYANALYVPQLSAILLSSRVHRRAAEGCSFIADHSGCFLTYPDFAIKIDDTDDCTIACRPIQDTTLPFDFDARRHLSQHSSKEAVRTAHALAFRAMTTSRLASIQKAANHTDKSIPNSGISDEFPTVPVYSVSNSGIGETERINTSELKRYFGCRKFANWKLLESTGTGIKVIKDREGPSTVGDFATIRRNKHGKLLDQPTCSLHTVGMDIGYGEGTSPGGFKYALTLVDYSTRHC
jgi:hypothetical protein